MSYSVVLTVSDPWDLTGSGDVHGKVSDWSATEVRVRLDEPLTIAGRAYELAVCSPRYVGTAFTKDMTEVPVNIALGSLAGGSGDAAAVLAVGSLRHDR